jgi:hypothetical protein
MPNFYKLTPWLIKSVYGAGGAGRFTPHARHKTYALRAGHASNKKSVTAYRGTAASTSTLLHLSTRTATKSCQGYAHAGNAIASIATMSDVSNKLQTQPTKGK